jgi:hypothetical protein
VKQNTSRFSINFCAKEDAQSFSGPNNFIAKLNVHGFLLCLVEAPNVKRPNNGVMAKQWKQRGQVLH